MDKKFRTGDCEYTFKNAYESKNDKHLEKLLALVIIKINGQAMHNGQLMKNYIFFSFQELVGMGIYKNSESVYDNFMKDVETLIDFMRYIMVNKQEDIDEKMNTITGAYTKDEYCYIFINRRAEWGLLVKLIFDYLV